jgi:hypothetical protein
MGKQVAIESIVSLWADVALTQGLLKVSGLFRSGEPLPEVYLYLADRYGRLARCYGRKGRKEREKIMDGKAANYFRLGGGEPPKSVAMAMPRPRPPIFTNAFGTKPNGEG